MSAIRILQKLGYLGTLVESELGEGNPSGCASLQLSEAIGENNDFPERLFNPIPIAVVAARLNALSMPNRQHLRRQRQEDSGPEAAATWRTQARQTTRPSCDPSPNSLLNHRDSLSSGASDFTSDTGGGIKSGLQAGSAGQG